MADKKEIIIDGVDVSGCCQYMPRYMEDYDIDTLDYCRYHFKPCKDVDVKYCYFKQLKRKEQECEKLKEDIERWKSNFNGKVSAIEELLQQLDQFKNCLTEIKDMCSEIKCESLMQNSWCGNTDFKMGCCEKLFKKQILQIISEYEGEYNEKIR